MSEHWLAGLIQTDSTKMFVHGEKGLYIPLRREV